MAVAGSNFAIASSTDIYFTACAVLGGQPPSDARRMAAGSKMWMIGRLNWDLYDLNKSSIDLMLDRAVHNLICQVNNQILRMFLESRRLLDIPRNFSIYSFTRSDI